MARRTTRGAVVGAGAGAIIGNQTGNRSAGAAIGGATGAMIGNTRTYREQQRTLEHQRQMELKNHTNGHTNVRLNGHHHINF